MMGSDLAESTAISMILSRHNSVILKTALAHGQRIKESPQGIHTFLFVFSAFSAVKVSF
jgi:hypothetical protein